MSSRVLVLVRLIFDAIEQNVHRSFIYSLWYCNGLPKGNFQGQMLYVLANSSQNLFLL